MITFEAPVSRADRTRRAIRGIRSFVAQFPPKVARLLGEKDRLSIREAVQLEELAAESRALTAKWVELIGRLDRIRGFAAPALQARLVTAQPKKDPKPRKPKLSPEELYQVRRRAALNTHAKLRAQGKTHYWRQQNAAAYAEYLAKKEARDAAKANA